MVLSFLDFRTEAYNRFSYFIKSFRAFLRVFISVTDTLRIKNKRITFKCYFNQSIDFHKQIFKKTMSVAYYDHYFGAILSIKIIIRMITLSEEYNKHAEIQMGFITKYVRKH